MWDSGWDLKKREISSSGIKEKTEVFDATGMLGEGRQVCHLLEVLDG